jgi:F-type H+-transporting ATPase subunit alpha
VRKAAAEIPAEVSTRVDRADKLSAEDRETIIAIASQALEPFSHDPESNSEPEEEIKRPSKNETKAGPRSESGEKS